MEAVQRPRRLGRENGSPSSLGMNLGSCKRPTGFAGRPPLFGDSEAGPDAGDRAHAAEEQRLEREGARAPEDGHEAADEHPGSGAHADDGTTHGQLIGMPKADR